LNAESNVEILMRFNFFGLASLLGACPTTGS
jgi:hypothetical protein